MSRRDRYIPLDRPCAESLEVAVNALQHVRKRVRTLLQDRTGLEQPSYTTPDGQQKVMLQVDKEAENECARYVARYLGDDQVCVLGEETLWKFKELDLNTSHIEGSGDKVRLVAGPETRLTMIIDMIDGSDLVERNLGNWCSAMIFFRPGPSPKILFSLIHHEDGTIYGADGQGSFVIPPRGSKSTPLSSLKGPELRQLNKSVSDRELKDETAQIAICYYGQKQDHFSSLPSELLAWATVHPSSKRFRFYNLGGNPMMGRLANGENVHAVFEHIGQFPHDAAPGAFIGMMSGATLVDLSGRTISVDDLARYLMRPSGARLQYVLACTAELAGELAKVLGSARMFYLCLNSCGSGKIALQTSDPICNVCGTRMIPQDRRARSIKGPVAV